MKPSTYFKQRIIVHRTINNLSYEKIRKALLIEKFQIKTLEKFAKILKMSYALLIKNVQEETLCCLKTSWILLNSLLSPTDHLRLQ